MAMTAMTTPNRPVTYALLVIFTVDPSTAERRRTNRTSATRPNAGSRASTPPFTA